MRTPHTATNKGKRVKLILRSGSTIIDHFVSRTDKYITLKKHGRVRKSTVRAFIILKSA